MLSLFVVRCLSLSEVCCGFRCLALLLFVGVDCVFLRLLDVDSCSLLFCCSLFVVRCCLRSVLVTAFCFVSFVVTVNCC